MQVAIARVNMTEGALEFGECPRCGVVFRTSCEECGYRVDGLLTVTTSWDFTPQTVAAFASHDALRIMRRFVGKEPERLAQFSHLRYLYLSRYPLQFQWLRRNPLEVLELDSSNLESLDGIQSLKSLRVLRLTECRRLRTLDALGRCRGLRVLRVALCNRIRSWAPVAALRNLSLLSIEANGLRSLSFVSELEKLHTLALRTRTRLGKQQLRRIPKSLRRLVIARETAQIDDLRFLDETRPQLVIDVS